MDNVKLFRRRFIPNETVQLKDDEILYSDDKKIITKWKVLKPRKDFTHGYSYYVMDQNFKISKFFNLDKLIYIYCDIIETILIEEENSIIFNDLLADVIIYESGFVKVLDVGEIAEALEENLISISQGNKCLKTLDILLDMIYNNKINNYINELDTYIEKNF